MIRKYFYAVLFGTLIICMLVMDGLVLQPLTNQDSNLAYAAPRNNPERRADPYGPGRHLGPNGRTQPNCVQVPEPSTLILLGSGLTGIGVYLYSKRKHMK